MDYLPVESVDALVLDHPLPIGRQHYPIAFDSEIERLEYVDLSDCLTNRERGSSAFLEVFDEITDKETSRGKPRMYKIHIVRDPWGVEPKQGDTFTWKQNIITHLDGKPLTSQDMEAMNYIKSLLR